MPSSFSNLNFLDRADRRRWQRMCQDARNIAREYPAYDYRMMMCEEYARQLGPWYTIFALETFLKKPCWVGSASILEQVGERRIVIPDGPLKGGFYDAPKDEYLTIAQWEPEHFEQARFLLAELFGELIRPGDDSQRCEETALPQMHTMIWQVPYEGPKYWQERQH